MSDFWVGNAPVSWGVFEAGPLARRENPPYERVMDEIAATGYYGTELGPYGYFPTDPATLRRALAQRRLALGSAFVPVDITGADPEVALEEARTAGRLLAAMGVSQLILADADHSERAATAGRPGAQPQLTDSQWRQAAQLVEWIARDLAGLGLQVVFHHHVGTYVETPDDLRRLLALTDPELVGVCFDTGHYVYGGGDAVEGLRELGSRIRYVHLKDVWPERLARVRAERIPMEQAWELGVFSPLGAGTVDFPAVVEGLRRQDYAGWLIVEQDVVLDERGEATPSPVTGARDSREFLREACGV